MGYALGDITFDIKGSETLVKKAVCIMFELVKCPLSDPELSFLVHEIEGNNRAALEKILPQWSVEKALSQPPSNDVVMYFGNSSDLCTEVLSVAVDDLSVFCCYYRPTDKVIHYVLYKKNPGAVLLSVSSVIVPTLSELFFQHAKMLFHAASVYIPEADTGVMIAADSGGGKTTTTLSLLRNGAKMICDDLTLVGPGQNKTLTMSGFPEKMNLTEDTICFFPELAALRNEIAPNFHSKKYPVLISDVYGNNCMAKSCRLDLIYFISRKDDTPSATPMNLSEAFGKLLKACTFAIEQNPTKERASKLFSILGSAKIFKLNSGTDPDLLGRWIMDNCQKHLAS